MLDLLHAAPLTRGRLLALPESKPSDEARSVHSRPGPFRSIPSIRTGPLRREDQGQQAIPHSPEQIILEARSADDRKSAYRDRGSGAVATPD